MGGQEGQSRTKAKLNKFCILYFHTVFTTAAFAPTPPTRQRWEMRLGATAGKMSQALVHPPAKLLLPS